MGKYVWYLQTIDSHRVDIFSCCVHFCCATDADALLWIFFDGFLRYIDMLYYVYDCLRGQMGVALNWAHQVQIFWFLLTSESILDAHMID